MLTEIKTINFEAYKENAEERLSYTSSDTPRSFIRALEDIIKLCEYGQKLETENVNLKRQRDWLANFFSSLFTGTDLAQKYIECAEQATKE